jgi:protein required for attachment to host cells
VVGDGQKALFFRNQGDAEYPNFEVIDVMEHPNPPTRDQGTDRPGRSHSSASPRASALDETNWHKLEKHRFAKDVADALYAAAHGDKFSQLILVAPPMTLGDLRKQLHPEVADKVVADLAKDLTNMPSHEIERARARH